MKRIDWNALADRLQKPIDLILVAPFFWRLDRQLARIRNDAPHID